MFPNLLHLDILSGHLSYSFPYSELSVLDGCNEEISLGLQMTSVLPDELVDCSQKLSIAGQGSEVCVGLCLSR